MTPTSINYVTGDATQPIGDGPMLIAHVCNDVGAWGRGFVLAISKRWPQPEVAFRKSWQMEASRLGDVQLSNVGGSLYVVSMIAQHKLRSRGNPVPLSYADLARCLGRVEELAALLHASVHMPRIGCGLAGGTWDKIESLIQKHLCGAGIAVTVYDLGES